MRIFIAALLPEEVRELMGEYLRSIKPNIDGVNWEKPQKLHITVKFLGETQDQKVNEISEIVEGLTKKYSPFSTQITRLGGFPGLENPRVLYLGLSQNEELSAFQSEVELALEPLGFASEKRRFIPHVTMGRVKKRFSTKGPIPIPEKVSFGISHIGIIKSELRPGSSVYTPLKIFDLED